MGGHKNAVNNRSVNRLKKARQARQAKKSARTARGIVGKREAAVQINNTMSEKKKRLLLTAAKHALAREASRGQLEGEMTMTDASEVDSMLSTKRKSAAFKEEEVVTPVKTGRGTTLGGPPAV